MSKTHWEVRIYERHKSESSLLCRFSCASPENVLIELAEKSAYYTLRCEYEIEAEVQRICCKCHGLGYIKIRPALDVKIHLETCPDCQGRNLGNPIHFPEPKKFVPHIEIEELTSGQDL